jgi:hypothetical protein
MTKVGTPRYIEKAIKSLPRDTARKLAELCLQGARVTCSGPNPNWCVVTRLGGYTRSGEPGLAPTVEYAYRLYTKRLEHLRRLAEDSEFMSQQMAQRMLRTAGLE